MMQKKREKKKKEEEEEDQEAPLQADRAWRRHVAGVNEDRTGDKGGVTE